MKHSFFIAGSGAEMRLPAEKNPAGRRQQDFCITILFDAYGMMATFMTPSRFSSNNSYASLILSNG